MFKTSFVNNKTNPIYGGENNNILIKEIKDNCLTNTAPKNNEKINYYTEEKYPHNNHANKVKHSFVKKITNISKYNIDDNNNNKENRNNENYMNINYMYNPMNNSMKNPINFGNTNTTKVDINNNTINPTMNNNNKLYDIFNDLQLMAKTKNRIFYQNNNNDIDYFNSFNYTIANNNLDNLFDSYSVEKKISKIPIHYATVFKTDKKANFDFNKNTNSNSLSYNKKGSNKININTDRDYTLKQNINFTSNRKKININDNGNNNDFNNTILKKNLNKNIYTRENIPSNNLLRPYIEKCFDSITINNNNNVNFHEPKLYIFVENNNGISNKVKNENLKSYTNDNNTNNKTKNIFKLEKSNKVKNINNTIEQTKKVLNKRETTGNMEHNTKDKLFSKYGIHKINNNTIINDLNKVNKSITMDDNKKLLDFLKKKNLSLYNNKNIYNSLNETMKNKNNYLLKQNEIIFDPSIKNNNRNTINKSINLANNYNNYNFIDLGNNTLNHPSQYNNSISNKYSNIHNLVKSDSNMDGWSYNKGRIENQNICINKRYKINNNNPMIIRGKNLTINNYIVRPNINIETFENIDHKIKLQKMQKRKPNNCLDDNNKKNLKSMEYENNNKKKIPNNYNIGNNNIKPLENYKKIISVISDTTNSPVNKQNDSNFKKYKKFVKQYNN